MAKVKFSYEDYEKMMEEIMDDYLQEENMRRARRVMPAMPAMPLAERIRQSAQRLIMPKV